jgi:hypothetical protein
VLRTGIPWEDLPQELGFGSGMTCWRRLRVLTAAACSPPKSGHSEVRLGVVLPRPLRAQQAISMTLASFVTQVLAWRLRRKVSGSTMLA